MFTGIIKETAVFLKKEAHALWLAQPWTDPEKGESISVNGVCLTLVSADGKKMKFDVSEETWKKTTLKYLRQGESVNLERSLRAGDKIGGHFVYGHVDGVVRILRRWKEGSFVSLILRIPLDWRRSIVPRGSLAVDGVSLTVAEVHDDEVLLVLVPETLRQTGLLLKKAGDRVNIELDMLMKRGGL